MAELFGGLTGTVGTPAVVAAGAAAEDGAGMAAVPGEAGSFLMRRLEDGVDGEAKMAGASTDTKRVNLPYRHKKHDS